MWEPISDSIIKVGCIFVNLECFGDNTDFYPCLEPPRNGFPKRHAVVGLIEDVEIWIVAELMLLKLIIIS